MFQPWKDLYVFFFNPDHLPHGIYIQAVDLVELLGNQGTYPIISSSLTLVLIVFKCLVLPQIMVAWKSLRNACKTPLYCFLLSNGENAASNVRIFWNLKFWSMFLSFIFCNPLVLQYSHLIQTFIATLKPITKVLFSQCLG